MTYKYKNKIPTNAPKLNRILGAQKELLESTELAKLLAITNAIKTNHNTSGLLLSFLYFSTIAIIANITVIDKKISNQFLGNIP